MLCVKEVTKRYGDTVALDRVSYEVGRGDVVGFLGPNGAGKTTCMRIIACFIPATEGTVTVDGLDVFRDSLAVRRRIGYLPENVPLYPDMRVEEYLDFRAKLKAVGRRRVRTAHVERAMERCFVADVRRKPIGALSKGYRQRVGLADALLGSPKLLILDEPTVGLDPNQVRETRRLIRELGEEHTILLSTHILSEVEATCGRVVIVHQGRIVAQDEVHALKERQAGEARTIEVELLGAGHAIDAAIGALPGVLRFLRRDVGERAHVLTVEPVPGRDLREAVGRLALDHGFVVREMRSAAPSLEDIFARVTAHGGAPAAGTGTGTGTDTSAGARAGANAGAAGT